MKTDKNGMPYSLEAEQALLGCIILDNGILPGVLETVKEDDFYVESHGYIFKAIMTVFRDRKPIDIVTLADTLDSSGKMENAGGLKYLVGLAENVPSSANYGYYLDIVRRDGILRRIMRVSRDISEHAKSSEDASEAIRYAETQLYAVSKTQDTSTVEDIRESDLLGRVLERFNALAENKEAFRGVQTGLFRLDKLTNGLQKSDLIIIAARPGMGKTSLAMNIVEHAAVYDGKLCAVFSLEMPKIQIMQRLLCCNAAVSMSKVLSGQLTPDDWKRIALAHKRLAESAIIIDDSPRVTPAEILSKCRRIKAANGGKLDLVMIDYIQLMSYGKANAEKNRTQEMTDITRELKLTAKELDVPIIALSQLKRQTGEPQLSDLRESGSIEQDADIVMLINRPDVTASEEEIKSGKIVKGAAVLNVAKHRNGETAKLPLRFRGEVVKFVDAEYEG